MMGVSDDVGYDELQRRYFFFKFLLIEIFLEKTCRALWKIYDGIYGFL